MKRAVSLALVIVLFLLIGSIPSAVGQSYLSHGYCRVSLKGNTLIFSLENPSDENIRHMYQSSRHIDYYIFGKNFFYHYAEYHPEISAITYVDVAPHSSVVLDTFTLPPTDTPYYIYADFLVCRPRLYKVIGGNIYEDIPSIFAVETRVSKLYYMIGQNITVTVSLVSRVPLARGASIAIDFSPSPVLTIFYEDGSIDSETFTSATIYLERGTPVIFLKGIKVKNPVRAIYVLLDTVSFSISGGTQYLEKMPPISVPLYEIIDSGQPTITGVPYWAQKDVFSVYSMHIFPPSVFLDMEKPISREELARGLASILGLPAMSFSHTFLDVRKYIWGSYLSSLQWHYILKGFPDGTARGDLPLSRSQMVAILARILPPRPGRVSFSDVKKTDWYYPYLEKIQGYGIFKGWNGKFYGDSPLSKAETVIIIKRLLPYLQSAYLPQHP